MARLLLGLAWFLVTSAGSAAAARAQEPRPAAAPFVHDKADQWFVQDAVGYGLAHEERLRLIARSAGTPALRDAAARMLPGQLALNAQIKVLASRRDIPLPLDLADDVTLVRQALDGLSGESFDRVALAQLRRGYEIQTGLFAQEARLGLDVELRAWAKQTLITLQEQQQLAASLR